MNIENKNISSLIVKHINKTIDVSESEILNKWLDDPYNKMQFDEIVNPENIDKEMTARFYFKEKQDWNKINKKIGNQKNLQEWLAYASAILLPLAVGVLVLMQNNAQTTDFVASISDSFEPESQHASIVLDDGETYLLTSNDTLINTKGAKINIDSSNISYQYEGASNQAELKYNTLNIPKGMKYQLQLSDGTKVWLNAQTTLKYPVEFIGNKREVFITEGEAYFDVSKDEEKPFIVNFQEARVKVLGTRFNVKAYEDEEIETVTLEEGSVLVEKAENEIILVPNQQANLHRSKNKIEVNTVDAKIYSAWRQGVLKYKNIALSQIMNDLQRHYDFKVFYQSQRIQQKRFSISLNPKNSVVEILEILKSTGNVDFETKGNVITIKNK